MCTEALVLVYSFHIQSISRKKFHGHIDNKVFLRYFQCQLHLFTIFLLSNMHSCVIHQCRTLIHLVLSHRSSTTARAQGRGKAVFSFKASVCSGRRMPWLIQQPGRPHLISFKTRLLESHMHIICMCNDALASQPPDAFFRSMNAILWLWRQTRKISTFTRSVSVPYTGKDPMDGRESCVFLLFALIRTWTQETFPQI